MLKAYINYPEPHVTAHFDLGCGKIQSQNKEDQRYLRIKIDTLSAELNKFKNKEYRFGTFPYNDMWLEIDFQNHTFELAVLEYINFLLGKKYNPFKNVKPTVHC